MATQKKRPTGARKKQRPRRPANKKTARVKTGRKKAVAKKAAARPKPAARRKAAAPKKAVARGKTGSAGRRQGVSPAAAAEFLNQQQQLAKLSAEPSITRSVSRGAVMPADTAAPDGARMPEGFFSAYTGTPLTEQDFADAAQTLGCDVAAVKAVAEVESAGAGFDASNRPTILYERHIFSRNTVPRGRFDATHPDVSAPTPYPPGTYGTKEQQFAKLARAFQLDPDAALKAPSWGKFQILGENFKACGFACVADYVKAMTISEGEHLKAFVKFLLGSPKRVQALRNKDWATFALYYNGPQYAKFKYDTKLAGAYAKHAQSA